MKIANTDLRALAVFRAVVEHQGFAGAQIALGLSQSAISFHVKALEERLGFALCRRGRGGFALTERGALVHARSDALFLSLDAFESEVGRLRDRITGTLRIGMIDNTVTDSGLPLPQVIGRIGARAPEARLDIAMADPETLVARLAGGALDLAILPETRLAEGLRLSPLHEERHLLYCGRGHPLFPRAAEVTETAEIARWPFVGRPYANQRELGPFPGAVMPASAANMEAQAMFLLSGRYIGYLPAHYAKAHVAAGDLRVLGTGFPLSSPLMLATRAGVRATPLQDLFLRELIAAIAAQASAG